MTEDVFMDVEFSFRFVEESSLPQNHTIQPSCRFRVFAVPFLQDSVFGRFSKWARLPVEFNKFMTSTFE